MKMKEIQQSPLVRAHHVSEIVRDLDRACEYYESIGLGVFEKANLEFDEQRYLGKPFSVLGIKVRAKFCHLGRIRFEVTGGIEGESFWKEFLEARGGGIHHIGFCVDDIDGLKARLHESGLELPYTSKYKGGGGSAMISKEKADPFAFELMQYSSALGNSNVVLREETRERYRPFETVSHISVIVRDIDRAIKYYGLLGLGSFEPSKVVATEVEMRGKCIDPGSIRVKRKAAQTGKIKLELIEPVQGRSLWKELLETRGEGVHVIAFSVDDIEKEEAGLVQRGLSVVFKTRFNDGGTTDFGTEIGPTIIELVQWPRDN